MSSEISLQFLLNNAWCNASYVQHVIGLSERREKKSENGCTLSTPRDGGRKSRPSIQASSLDYRLRTRTFYCTAHMPCCSDTHVTRNGHFFMVQYVVIVQLLPIMSTVTIKRCDLFRDASLRQRGVCRPLNAVTTCSSGMGVTTCA